MKWSKTIMINTFVDPCHGESQLALQCLAEHHREQCTHFQAVVCLNFGHPAITVNGLAVLKLFQLSNADLLFALNAYSIYKAR